MSKPETETKQTTPNASTPNAGAPKAEPKADAGNPFAPFLNFASFASFAKMPFGPEAFAPWLREHADRVEQIADEVAVFEKAMMQRIKASATDIAALVQDTLAYVQQVGTEWRKLAIDTARRASDFTARA